MLLPVILAGGTGTRLWPLSRTLHPKQFLTLHGHETMLQTTIRRLDGLTDRAPIVICNDDHRFLAAEQLREINAAHAAIMLEPIPRNTAPAIALAALHAMAAGDDPLLLVLPADHVIENPEVFRRRVSQAVPLAHAGWLVTFGIVPDRAETGYGYIARGRRIGEDEEAYAIARFVEKPDADTAAAYLAQGDMDWNSGMFLFRASRYLEELDSFEPEISVCCADALAAARPDLDFLRIDRQAFAASPAISLDHAIMERTARAAVVPLDAGWNDVGSWTALRDIAKHDAAGNAISGDVFVHATNDTLIHASSRLVAAVGVSNLVIIETGDAVLVAEGDRVQEVREIVETLKRHDRRELRDHRRSFRPWGRLDTLGAGEHDVVRRIVLQPGEKIAMQLHRRRAEHWIVVSGRAAVVMGEDRLMLSHNQSTYIPAGVIHALENPGDEPLEIIEVQTGNYIGEDDVVRFDCRGRPDDPELERP